MPKERKPTGMLIVCNQVGGGGWASWWDKNGVIAHGRRPGVWILAADDNDGPACAAEPEPSAS